MFGLFKVKSHTKPSPNDFKPSQANTKRTMKRRAFLQNSRLLSAGVTASPSFFHILKREKATEDVIIGHGDFRYKVHKSWAKIN